MVWDGPEHFLDRVAQMVLATLYTHHHIDVGAEGVTGVKPKKAEKAIKNNIDAALRSGNAMVQSNNTNNSDLGTLVHKIPSNTADYRGSEASENCVAAAVVDGFLYLAVNFKVRRNPPEADSFTKLSKFEVSGFNEVNAIARKQILDILRKEIQSVSITPPLPGEELADRIRKVVFVSPITPASNASETSAFHAEMQLVSYLLCEKERWLKGVYFGVNKPCCQDCTLQLKKLGIQFASSHNRRVTNWVHWSSQKASAKATHEF